MLRDIKSFIWNETNIISMIFIFIAGRKIP